MTVETKTTLELKDIKAIEFECANCHAKTVFPVAKYENPPTRCASCESPQWLIPGSEEWEGLNRLGKTIRKISESRQPSFTLRLEILNPSMPSVSQK